MTSAEAAQYQLLDHGAVWRDLCSRGKLRVSGPDSIAFLHALASNDIRGLAEFQGRHAALLSATGKIQADFLCYRFPRFLLIDVAAERVAGLLEKLTGYIIMDEVEVEDVSRRVAHFAVEGPQSGRLVREILGIEPPGVPLMVAPAGEPPPDGPLAEPVVVRRDLLSDSGFEILAPEEHAVGIRRALQVLGPELSPEVVRVRLIERGVPEFGREFTERNNPVEVGLDSAYSLEKGCYPGQEVVSKAVFVGGVARKLCRLRLEGSRVPPPEASVQSGGQEVGWVVSAAFSPKSGAPLAFAYLRRALAEAGQRVEVLFDDGSRATAVVDPGRPAAEAAAGASGGDGR
ncbi:MAG: glycine cleavage system aminomethyltransferase GcvT [Acidobacteriota bacterium]